MQQLLLFGGALRTDATGMDSYLCMESRGPINETVVRSLPIPPPGRASCVVGQYGSAS